MRRLSRSRISSTRMTLQFIFNHFVHLTYASRADAILITNLNSNFQVNSTKIQQKHELSRNSVCTYLNFRLNGKLWNFSRNLHLGKSKIHDCFFCLGSPGSLHPKVFHPSPITHLSGIGLSYISGCITVSNYGIQRFGFFCFFLERKIDIKFRITEGELRSYTTVGDSGPRSNQCFNIQITYIVLSISCLSSFIFLDTFVSCNKYYKTQFSSAKWLVSSPSTNPINFFVIFIRPSLMNTMIWDINLTHFWFYDVSYGFDHHFPWLQKLIF